MEPLRLGFIGAGEMATFAVFPALHFAPIRLHAVCDLDEERAKAAAGTFGASRWYTDYRRMWEEEDLEAVVVQMHPRPRQAIVREALETGLPIPPRAEGTDRPRRRSGVRGDSVLSHRRSRRPNRRGRVSRS
jgi:predicted dehydrogenase